jgi:hypothetical protein
MHIIYIKIVLYEEGSAMRREKESMCVCMCERVREKMMKEKKRDPQSHTEREGEREKYIRTFLDLSPLNIPTG